MTFYFRERTGRIRSLLQGVLTFCMAACVVLLAACGGGPSTSPQTSTSPHILTMGVTPQGNFVENFNPFLVPYGTGNLFGTEGLVYEPLYFFNQAGPGSEGLLAQSYTLNSTATSVTFHLRSGVQWSDGQPFSSADVVFTLNLLKQYPALDSNGLWQTIKDVSAPDGSTVVVDFQKAAQPFIWYLAGQTYIVPQHIWQGVSDPTKYTDTSPVTTGPFVVKAFTPSLYSLVKNPKYWDASQIQVDQINFPAFNSNTTGAQFLAQGNLDWMGIFEANIQKVYINLDSKHNHYWFPGTQTTMLFMNLSKFPFSVLGVRQAIAAAIDRTQIQNVGESGYQTPAHPTGLVLPANQSYLDPQYSSQAYKVDTAQATQDLQQAGFAKDGSGIWAKNGQEISFTIQAPTGWTDWDTDCQLVQSELQALGMKVQVLAPSVAQYITNLSSGSFDTAIHWTNTGPSPYYLYNFLLNSAFSAPIGKSATSNYERWTDSKTDQLLATYAGTSDQNAQMQAIYGLEQIMVTQVPTIPLVYGSNWYEYSTARFTGWPDASNAYALPGPFNQPDTEIILQHLRVAA